MNAAVRSQMVESLVATVGACIPKIDRRTGRVGFPGVQYRHQHIGYALGWLYATKTAGNPYFGRKYILELAIRTNEFKFTYQTKRGGFDADDAKEQGDEWAAYFMLRTMEVLGRRTLGAARWALWTKRLSRYVSCHGARPFFFSAPNHEAWKALTLDLAGRVMKRPELVRMADFGITQLLRYQLAPGFWDENRHHGPSMSYNYIMAEPLYMYWLATGRRDVREALERLEDFMARYAMPDGSTSGALDGRVGYSPARFSHAMTLTPRGRRLNELALENWVRPVKPGTTADEIHPDAPSSTAWAADALRFSGEGKARPLGQESDGFRVEDHDRNFHALARRQGPWHVTLSGVFSDIPKETDNIFRLERQNRIDLWHERTGLIVGGGHTHREIKQHLANLFLDTDYFADVDFGVVTGRFPDTVRSTFYPRLIGVASDGSASKLALTFGHAQAEFTLRPRSARVFTIALDMRSVGLRRAFAGVPLVVARGAEVKVDGRKLAAREGRPQAVKRKVEVTGSLRGAAWELELPRGVRAKIHEPFSPSHGHFDKKIRVFHRPLHEVALLAVELETSGKPLPGPIVLRIK